MEECYRSPTIHPDFIKKIIEDIDIDINKFLYDKTYNEVPIKYMYSNIADDITENSDIEELLEHLAEECMELAQACLKLARKYRSNDISFNKEKKLIEKINKEFTDVILLTYFLRIDIDVKSMTQKLIKWKDKIGEKND